LIDQGAQVVEVFPQKARRSTCRRAVNIPLKGFTQESAGALDQDPAIIVYIDDATTGPDAGGIQFSPGERCQITWS
jgi:hypothetical protein